MSEPSAAPPRQLPARPNLRHLKDQAKERLRAGQCASLSAAQYLIAREYGFASWPKLRAHVQAIEDTVHLQEAIDGNDLGAVQRLLLANPGLHRAPLGYGRDGPLTWVAECRVPREAPSAQRLAIADWMITHGSDVHQGGDAPLMRAALSGERIAMMQLLVDRGADVNAAWHGTYPILFAPCETLSVRSLQWLLEHGADPNCGTAAQWQARGQRHPGTALDYLLGTYLRDPLALRQCLDVLRDAGARTRVDSRVVMAVCGDSAALAAALKDDPTLVHRRFEGLAIGTTAGRLLTLNGATLLHVAAEFHQTDVAALLVAQGADVNARATIDEHGLGGQTALFHAASQNEDGGLDVLRLLLEQHADTGVVARIPGHYERTDELFEGTALEYAERFPGNGAATLQCLRQYLRP